MVLRIEEAADDPTFRLLGELTQPMSNQAAAIVVLPIALQTAFDMQLNPRAFGR